jgi:hypothetical protein
MVSGVVGAEFASATAPVRLKPKAPSFVHAKRRGKHMTLECKIIKFAKDLSVADMRPTFLANICTAKSSRTECFPSGIWRSNSA